MKRALLLVVIAAAAGAGVWMWKDNLHIHDYIDQYIENGDFPTLEARYTPQQLMDDNRKSLLPNDQYSFQDPIIKFAPHLLINAKYAQGDKGTKETSLLWSLVDGEFILDTDTWETTHGFADAIEAKANRSDFRVLFALAKNKGTGSREQLQRDLHLERDILDPWITSALDKKLIVQHGSDLQIHLEDPKIYVAPQTKIRQAFVTKPYDHGARMSRKFNKAQVEAIAQAAFGPSFTIRNSSEIYLPIYCLCVMNPDGSLHTSYWNALSGEQVVNNLEFRKL